MGKDERIIAFPGKQPMESITPSAVSIIYAIAGSPVAAAGLR